VQHRFADVTDRTCPRTGLALTSPNPVARRQRHDFAPCTVRYMIMSNTQLPAAPFHTNHLRKSAATELARLTQANGKVSRLAEMRAVARAQAAGVTFSDFIRARLTFGLRLLSSQAIDEDDFDPDHTSAGCN
jgi:hypothetical protein